MQLIPAVDILNGRCVRTTKGDFTLFKEYSDHPIDVIQGFLDEGATLIHLIDLDGARSGAIQQLELIQTVLKRFESKIQVGGGVRTLDQVRTLLDHGARRVVLGNVAVREPTKLIEWTKSLGADRILVAVDLVEGQLATQGWKRVDETKSLDVLIEEFIANGIRDFICTDTSRDGMLEGPNLELYSQFVTRYPNARWTASGGVGSVADLLALKSIGVESVVIGKALYEHRFTLKQALESIAD